jgi:hypothetical protein
VSYFAPDTAGTATLTATGGGCSCSITFTIVAPSSVAMDRVSAVQHTQGYPDVGMYTSICIGPDDVSFYNIQYHEVDVPMQGDGVYACHVGEGHDAHPATLDASTTVVSGKGTKMNAQDHVYSGWCTAYPVSTGGSGGGSGSSPTTGYELFPIPYEYKVGSGSFHNFATVDQRITCDASGALTATKGGATADTTVTSATVTI